MKNRGFVIWFTGISGSGKTTLAGLTEELLKHNGRRAQVIDGDLARQLFGNDLGYTRGARIENIKRIIFAASLLAENNIAVIVANIAPYYEIRDLARKIIKNYIQVYLDIDVNTAKKRDNKGLYKAYAEGKTRNIVGLDDPYDVPRNPDLVIRADIQHPQESLYKIKELLSRKGMISYGSR